MKKILTHTIFLATCVAFVFGIAACGGEKRPENLRFNYTYTAERPVAEARSAFESGHYSNGIFIYDIPRLYQGYGFDAFTSFYEEEFSKISEDRFYFLDTSEHTIPNGLIPCYYPSGEIEIVDINEDPAIDEYRIVQDFSIYDDDLGYPRYFGKPHEIKDGEYVPSSVDFYVVFLPTAASEGELRFEFGKQEKTRDYINIYIGEQCIGTLFRSSYSDPDWIDVFVPETWYKNFFEKNLIRG